MYIPSHELSVIDMLVVHLWNQCLAMYVTPLLIFKCEVWVRGVKGEVWSGECRCEVLSVMYKVWSVKRKVWSVKRKVWSAARGCNFFSRRVRF